MTARRMPSATAAYSKYFPKKRVSVEQIVSGPGEGDKERECGRQVTQLAREEG